jgi:effector-binding domain-containing protein
MDFGIQIRDCKPQKIAAIRAKTTINKVTPKVVQLLQETADYLESVGVEPTGPGFGVYYEVGAFLVDVEVGYPVDVDVEGNGRVLPNSLPGGKCAVAHYKGPHEQIAEAHRAVHTWMHSNDVQASGEPAREIYLTDLRGIDEGDDCEAESVWPIIHETRAERRRQQRAKA